MGQIQHQHPNSFGAFGVNNSNNTNSPFFPSSVNQPPNQMVTNSPSIRSYADYRASSVLPPSNAPPPMYPPFTNTQNPALPRQSRTFNEFGLSSSSTHGPSNPHGRSGGPPFSNEATRYGNFEHQSQMEQSPQTSWRGPSRGANNVRGRGRGGGGGHFQSANKQPGSTFSFSSSKNNSSMRGRGAGRNTRNFGSRR
jgi:hypothetical protein